MVKVIRREVRRRGFFGWVFLVIFLAFNALMALMMWVLLTQGGAALLVGIILLVWTMGAVITGLLAMLTRGRKTIIEDSASTAAQGPEVTPPQEGPQEPSQRRTDYTTAGFDHAKWNALIKYDQEIAMAAEKLKPLGDRWVNEFASSYLALNDKNYLHSIVQKIAADARREEEEPAR